MYCDETGGMFSGVIWWNYNVNMVVNIDVWVIMSQWTTTAAHCTHYLNNYMLHSGLTQENQIILHHIVIIIKLPSLFFVNFHFTIIRDGSNISNIKFGKVSDLKKWAMMIML